jgi:UDP:flavonoid glycosyltransferase YjiC (YdhE family)
VPTPVKINNLADRPFTVVLAPLDWGLGHATRCIPIIKELLNQRCEVIIAASGVQQTLLQGEFPSLTFVELPGYRIKYGKNRAFTILRLLFSIPKILIRVNRENAWLRRWVSIHRPDLVISDNRYGLYSPDVYSIFMTHQLLIRTPFGRMADQLLQRLNYRFINRFSLCWVPDTEPGGLAGELSHPGRMPAIPVRYIGWLSRFSYAYDEGRQGLLVLLSGPEPQRTLFEKQVLAQVADFPWTVMLVRGLPEGGEPVKPLRNLIVYDHLPAAALEFAIREAGIVLARSGYSTVMDLARMCKRAVLVPTPGQTEQEYLGRYLETQGWAGYMEQRELDLSRVNALSKAFPYTLPATGTLEAGIKVVLAEIQSAGDDLG